MVQPPRPPARRRFLDIEKNQKLQNKSPPNTPESGSCSEQEVEGNRFNLRRQTSAQRSEVKHRHEAAWGPVQTSSCSGSEGFQVHNGRLKPAPFTDDTGTSSGLVLLSGVGHFRLESSF